MEAIKKPIWAIVKHPDREYDKYSLMKTMKLKFDKNDMKNPNLDRDSNYYVILPDDGVETDWGDNLEEMRIRCDLKGLHIEDDHIFDYWDATIKMVHFFYGGKDNVPKEDEEFAYVKNRRRVTALYPVVSSKKIVRKNKKKNSVVKKTEEEKKKKKEDVQTAKS